MQLILSKQCNDINIYRGSFMKLHCVILTIYTRPIKNLPCHSSYIAAMTSPIRHRNLRSRNSKEANNVEDIPVCTKSTKKRNFGKSQPSKELDFFTAKHDTPSVAPVATEKVKFSKKKYLKNDLKLMPLPSAETSKTSVENLDPLSGCSIKSANRKKLMDFPLAPPLSYKSFDLAPSSVPVTGKKYVGCHVSAAGGIWNSFENGTQSSAKSIAMFLRNQRSWNAKPLDQPTIEKWKAARMDFPQHLILPHGSYLMNLGSPNEETLKKSRDLLIEELKRCEMLGIPHFNFHPGSSLGEITRAECCSLIAESINLAHKETRNVICVIENMSKQGFTMGGDFNEIRFIIDLVNDKTRVGVCLDTCHSHAAGYDLSTEIGFNTFLNDFEKCIGWKFLRGLHINDSKGKSGDHLDRHENIGKGTIGIDGFRRIMNCPKFNDIPLILETPFIDEKTYGKEIALLESLISES